MSPRGGPRPGSGRKPADPDAKRKPVVILLTHGELATARWGQEPHESWQDFAREALATLPRYRVAITEIESMIAGCKLTEAQLAGRAVRGKQLETTETQRRTLEFVLGLLKPPAKRRSQLQGGG